MARKDRPEGRLALLCCQKEGAFDKRKEMLHFIFSLISSAKLHQREGLMDIAALNYYRSVLDTTIVPECVW